MLRTPFFLLLITGHCFSIDSAMMKANDEIKTAVVAIACAEKISDAQRKLKSIEGTGFFVSNDGMFLTAGHVGRNLQTPACGTPVIFFPSAGWHNGPFVEAIWFDIKDCYYDASLDLAKCRTIQNPFTTDALKIKPTTVSFQTSVPKEGTEVGFVGFPLQLVRPVVARATVAGYRGNPGESSPREIIIDHNNWPGMSGAPVYLENGKVIGLILKRGANDAVGLAFARSSEFILPFLATPFPSDK